MAYKALILLNRKLTVTPPSGNFRSIAGPPSPFCIALNIIAQMDGDEMYMTSGFHSGYSFMDLGNNFSNNIVKGFSKYSNANLRLLAGSYTDNKGIILTNCVNFKCKCGVVKGTHKCHPKRYKKFYQNIRDGLKKNKNIKVTPHIFGRWHSKVTFKTKGSSYIAFLIGSSNISSRALTRFNTSNTECDIFIYDSSYEPTVKKEMATELGKTAFSFDVSSINRIGNAIQKTTDASSLLAFKDKSHANFSIPDENDVFFLINEAVTDVLNCYHQLAKPLTSFEGI